jgi:hypothetical protein
MKLVCECGMELTAHHEENGVRYFACMNADHKDRPNCYLVIDDMHQESIAHMWLSEQLTEYDWNKKKVMDWVNGIWKEFLQYRFDNR